MLASITLFHMDAGMSKAAAETRALCDEEYTTYLVRVTNARHEANLAKIKHEVCARRSHARSYVALTCGEQSFKKQLDLIRTYESSKRCAPHRTSGGTAPSRASPWLRSAEMQLR